MKKYFLVLSLIVGLFFSGCGANQSNSSSAAQQTQAFLQMVETSIVETLSAAVSESAQTATSQVVESVINTPVPSLTSTVAPAVSTVVPTQGAGVFTPTPTALPTPCYLAVLVEETIPDGTIIKIGDGFTKTWVVRNAGVCSWSENFRWILVEGGDFRGDTDVKISRDDVEPGDTITISIEMGAPMIPGRYYSVYKIFTEDGVEITPNGFWIDVTVEEN